MTVEPCPPPDGSEARSRLFQEELAATDREVLALALDLDRRAAAREAENLALRLEFQRSNGDTLRLVLDLEDRIGERGRELEALRTDMERRIQERTAQAEAANKARSVFLANLSHEIRTPLSAILGFSRMLKDGGLEPRHQAFLDNINRAGEHLLGTVNAVLELLKIEAGHAQQHAAPLNFRRLAQDLEQLFRLQAETKGLAFEVQDQGVPDCILADEGRLRQILGNLLDNAIKFTECGQVTLRFWSSQPAPAEARLVAEVEDTGPGITPQDLGRLFMPFEQGAQGLGKGGTGLGLAISRQFARLMGGEVSVASRPAAGSCFRLEVPVGCCTPGPEAPGLAAGRSLSLAGDPVRVLVTDDHPWSRQLLTELLVAAGFEVREAADGVAALELHRSWRPHAVLLDLQMPGMDGLDALRRMRTDGRGRRTLVLIVTADDREESRRAASAAGADGYITKPFLEAEILDQLRAHLGPRCQSLDPAPAARPLAGVPAQWRERLRSAVLDADYQEILETIRRIRGLDARAGDCLLPHALDFRYDEMLRLLDREDRP
jgi:signal transduction histidine kinase/DNA-binding NarL/FixJ family response regulator